MSGTDSEDGRKSVEIQEYEYLLYFGRNGIVWFEDVLRKGLATRKILWAEYWFCSFFSFTRDVLCLVFNGDQLKYQKSVNMSFGNLLGPVLDNRARKVVEEHWLESQLEKKEIKSLEIEHETKSNRNN